MQWADETGFVTHEQTFQCGACKCSWAPRATWPTRAMEGDIPHDVPLFCPQCMRQVAVFNPRPPAAPRAWLWRVLERIAQPWAAFVCRTRGHRSSIKHEFTRQLPTWLECSRCHRLQGIPQLGPQLATELVQQQQRQSQAHH